jgi:hypothetical protein
MWLPTPVYERLPQFFLLLGLLFVSNGLYLGFDFGVAFVYIGFGMWCSAYGVGIFVVRMVRRSQPATVDAANDSVIEESGPAANPAS